MGVGVIAYFEAVAVLPVALTTLIYLSYPLFTALLGRVLFGLRPSRADALGCGAVLVACLLMLGRPGELDPGQYRALSLAFLAPLAFAVLILMNAHCLRALPTLPRYAASIWGCFAVALVVNTWITPAPVGLPTSPVGWLALLGMGILASALPQLLFTVGAPVAGPNRTALAGSAELLLGLLTGWLLLAETVEPLQLLGGLLIGGALLLGARS
jgi:drug/metabolite transporter (DMT)-like permease